MRFIHTADWQLGKPFGRFEPEVRSALTEARFDAVDAIGRAAVANGAGHVLVAGDAFDCEMPDERTLIQALSRIERHAVRWWLLPGNHDNVRSDGLWSRVARRSPPNVVALTAAEPVELEEGAWLLPAPLLHRHSVEDPTEVLDGMETPFATLRIGLAHGSVRDFGSRGDSPNLIAADRSTKARLDYLALGDWHGTLQVGARTWYSGTPEPDRFVRDDPGRALLVDLVPGREPEVAEVKVGRFRWLTRRIEIGDREAYAAARDALVAEVDPARTLLSLTLAGIVGLEDRIAILEAVEGDLRHRLRHLDLDAEELVGRPTEADLDALRIEGALGAAAEALQAAVGQGGDGAALARRALERLFVEHRRAETA